MSIPNNIVRVRKNDFGEFEVPTIEFEPLEFDTDHQAKVAFNDSIYFADDKQDAIDTARFTYGPDVQIRITRGTYSQGANA